MRLRWLVWECWYFVRGHVSVTYTPPSAMLFVGYMSARGHGHAVSKACGRGPAVSKAAGPAGTGLDMVVPRS